MPDEKRIEAFLRMSKSRYTTDMFERGNLAISNYEILYTLNIVHLLKGEDARQHIVNKLQVLSLKLDKEGFLKEEYGYLLPGKHSMEYIKLHLSSLYYQLVLEYMPEHPGIRGLKLLSNEDLASKLQDLDLSDAWRVSNIVMGYAVLLAYNQKKGWNIGSLQVISDYLIETRGRHGMWESSVKPSVINSMAATFHYIPLFKYMGVCIDEKNSLVDKVLDLRVGNGFFSSPKGYSCIEYDAMYILNYASSFPEVTENRKRAILDAALDLRTAITEIQNQDGGFSDYGPRSVFLKDLWSCIASFERHRDFNTLVWNLKKIYRLYFLSDRSVMANSIITCSALPNESNTFSTWFKMLTLRECEEVIQRLCPEQSNMLASLKWKKLNLPGLGY